MKNIKLKGAGNVRDLAGLPVQGGIIRPKRLLRSSELSTLRAEDQRILCESYGLKTVIDLRTAVEKAEKPDVIMPGVRLLEMPIFDDSIPGMSHESKQDIDHIPYLGDIYRYVMSSDCIYRLGEVVKTIVTAPPQEFAFLYHCTEGKDRTGMVTAMLLLLLGAERQTILEDYLFTNRVNHRKAVKYRFLVRYFKRNRAASEKVYNVFLAKEEYINELFAKADDIGMDALLQDVIGITDEEAETFRKFMTE